MPEPGWIRADGVEAPCQPAARWSMEPRLAVENTGKETPARKRQRSIGL